MSLEEIEKAIKKLDKVEQQKLLQNLLKLLNIDPESFSWLKVAEPSFAFWDNEDDAIYDNL